jgi:hypothetical protein
MAIITARAALNFGEVAGRFAAQMRRAHSRALLGVKLIKERRELKF